jgi:hypothetical protein
MTTITDIFRTYGPEYLERFGQDMPKNHHKVINAIINCHTAHYGASLFECDHCHDQQWVFRSCGDRHCPACQNHKTKQWLQWQLKRQLPGPHFLITFTVPEKVRPVMRSNQRVAYDALFQASSEALRLLAADERHVGGDLPGFYGILHTWGRTLTFHPHIHYIVAGGALSKADAKWHPSRPSFYVPNKALSKIYTAKFRDALNNASLLHHVPDEVWKAPWNVNIQAVGSCEQTIGYLAPYVFKVAISNSRITKVENRQVTFRYKKAKSSRWRTMALDVIEFIRRFLQHVLPAGFMKIRYYGFLHPSSSVPLQKVGIIIELTMGFETKVSKTLTEAPPVPLCPSCGGRMRHLYSVLPTKFAIRFNTG